DSGACGAGAAWCCARGDGDGQAQSCLNIRQTFDTKIKRPCGAVFLCLKRRLGLTANRSPVKLDEHSAVPYTFNKLQGGLMKRDKTAIALLAAREALGFAANAQAAFETANNIAGGGSLVLMAWDPVTSQTYVRDLGVNIN